MTKINGYLVTMTELKTMGLTPKGAIPADSNYIVSKGEISAAYYVDETAVPYSTYTSLRCPRYEDIVNTTTTTTTLATITYMRYDVSVGCATSNPTPFWSYNSYASGFYYINGGGTVYYLTPSSHTTYTNQITSVVGTTCVPPTTTTTTSSTTTTTSSTTTTTTTPAPVVYGYASIYFDGTGSSPLCNSTASTTKGLYWINNPTLTLGAQVWNNAARTISATAGWYGQQGAGSTWYYVQGGFVNNIGTCPTTTTTTSTSTSTTTTTSTTSTTTSTTSTTTTAIPCAYYTVYNPSTTTSVDVSWTDCAGFPGIGATVGPESYYSLTCARVGSVYGDGPIDVTYTGGCA